MPLYDYEITAAGTDEVLAVISLSRPVKERDAITIRRRTVPDSVAIAGSAANSRAPGRQVLDAYRRIEQRVGSSSEFHRRLGHRPTAIKKAWAA